MSTTSTDDRHIYIYISDEVDLQQEKR
jgi:hypothetical protein